MIDPRTLRKAPALIGAGALQFQERDPKMDQKPSFEPETIRLKDGLQVTIRPIRPDDAPRLQALVGRMSAESIFLRFLEYLKALTPKQAAFLANVDYQKRMALVAARDLEGEEQVIGVARYDANDPDRPDRAEVGIAVEDAYQNQGLGSTLLDRLTDYAKANGIRAFTATVSAQNARILHFVRRSGLPSERSLEMGMWEIEIQLDHQPE